MGRNNAIEVSGLTKVFRTPGNRKGHVVLDDLTFDVPRGTSVAITGANGSGKTTLLKVLSTLFLPDAGKTTIMGLDLIRDASEIRDKISFISPGLDFQRKLTLKENLDFFAKVQDAEPEAAYRLLDAMNMTHIIDERSETFSEGQKAITRLAIGLMKDVEILFLDEVTLGLDVNRREQVVSYLETQLNHKTILIIDHNSTVIDRLCDNVLILKSRGSLHRMLTIKELLSSLSYRFEITATPRRALDHREIKQIWPTYVKTGGMLRFYPKTKGEAQVINTRILSSGFITRAETRSIDLNEYAIRIADEESMDQEIQF